jgi:ABC-type phosphate transport system substrate-binding protein
MPRLLPFSLLLVLVLLTGNSLAGGMVVVVNARSGVEKLSRDEVINIFMGRFRQLPGNLTAEPVDQPDGMPEKALFYRLLVNKDISDINAYWTRLIFSGKTSPPYQAKDMDDMLDWLVKHKGAVGYVERSQVDSRLRIVLDLEH